MDLNVSMPNGPSKTASDFGRGRPNESGKNQRLAPGALALMRNRIPRLVVIIGPQCS
jgi:hypothetical protein